MNNKGFTVVEVVVSFAMVALILASMISFVVVYRDKIKNEEIRTELLDFKNTITKVVYDDIIYDEFLGIEYCVGEDNCVNFVDSDNNSHTLKVVDVAFSTVEMKKGLYLNYDGTNYFLPDSDLNKNGEFMSSFTDFNLRNYEDKLYSLKITFYHLGLDQNFDILLSVN